MAIVNKIVKWKYQGKIMDTFTVNANEQDINGRLKMAIINALNNTPDPVLQINWSTFGKDGDSIEIEDIPIGGEL